MSKTPVPDLAIISATRLDIAFLASLSAALDLSELNLEIAQYVVRGGNWMAVIEFRPVKHSEMLQIMTSNFHVRPLSNAGPVRSKLKGTSIRVPKAQ